MFGNNQQVERGMSRSGILDLRSDGMPRAGAPDRQRRHRGVAAATDNEIGPRRLQARAGSSNRPERQEPELRRQPSPWEADGEAFFDEREARRFGKTERLARHPRLAVMQNPSDRRRSAGSFERSAGVYRRNGGHRFRVRKALLYGKDGSVLAMAVVTQIGLHPGRARRHQPKATVTTS